MVNKLIIALALIPALASAQTKPEHEIMRMIAHAPMARTACGRMDYEEDCTKFVKYRISEDMLDSGFTEEQADACAETSLEVNEEKAKICVAAFGLSKEYEDYMGE